MNLLFEKSLKISHMLQKSKQPFYIDLMLINKVRLFQRSCFIQTGLFDFRKVTINVLKMQFRKLEPKVVYYGK